MSKKEILRATTLRNSGYNATKLWNNGSARQGQYRYEDGTTLIGGSQVGFIAFPQLSETIKEEQIIEIEIYAKNSGGAWTGKTVTFYSAKYDSYIDNLSPKEYLNTYIGTGSCVTIQGGSEDLELIEISDNLLNNLKTLLTTNRAASLCIYNKETLEDKTGQTPEQGKTWEAWTSNYVNLIEFEIHVTYEDEQFLAIRYDFNNCSGVTINSTNYKFGEYNRILNSDNSLYEDKLSYKEGTYTPKNPSFFDVSRPGYNFISYKTTRGATVTTSGSYTANDLGQGDTYTYLSGSNWDIIEYTISYNLNDGVISGGTNPVKYNVETSDFTLINPTKIGYTFDGWSGTGISGKSKSVKIPKGSTGNKSYTANWSENTITVKYHPNGATSGTYTSDGTTTTLSNLTSALTEPTRQLKYNTTQSKGLHDIQNSDGLYLSKNYHRPIPDKEWYYTREDGKKIEIDQSKSFSGKSFAKDIIGDENYIDNGNKTITVYANWEPYQVVRVYTDNEWKLAVPYIYQKNSDGTFSWKRAAPYVYNGGWKETH